jgi:hypothetical protein
MKTASDENGPRGPSCVVADLEIDSTAYANVYKLNGSYLMTIKPRVS